MQSSVFLDSINYKPFRCYYTADNKILDFNNDILLFCQFCSATNVPLNKYSIFGFTNIILLLIYCNYCFT